MSQSGQIGAQLHYLFDLVVGVIVVTNACEDPEYVRPVAIKGLQACISWARLYQFAQTFRASKNLFTIVCHEFLGRYLTSGPGHCTNRTWTGSLLYGMPATSQQPELL